MKFATNSHHVSENCRKSFSRSEVKIKVILYKCANAITAEEYILTESSLTSFVMYKIAHVRQLAQYGDYFFESSHLFRANTASGPEDKGSFEPSTVSISNEIH